MLGLDHDHFSFLPCTRLYIRWELTCRVVSVTHGATIILTTAQSFLPLADSNDAISFLDPFIGPCRGRRLAEERSSVSNSHVQGGFVSSGV